MGKPYEKELQRLSEVYGWAAGTPIDTLSKFVKKSAGLPLYVVGSGGSFSAAVLASLLHQQTGTMSRCVTPLEFLEFGNTDNDCSVLLVTAGGNNRDILSAFERATGLKPRSLGVLCASTDNRLVRRASGEPGTLVHAARPPTGRDGFLATNSLLATAVWLVRAYADNLPFFGALPGSLAALCGGMSAGELDERITGQLRALGGRDTIVVLHDSWGRVAAADAESKLVEAGLVNVQPTDYRNFAHGRHNWLDKNRQNTGMIALVTPGCARLAAGTTDLVPGYVPIVKLSSNLDGPAASLGLLVQVMYAVKFFGKIRYIDPGRPQVAPFGTKLYNMPVPQDGPEPRS